MILATSFGEFVIPAEVARQLPYVPDIPQVNAPDVDDRLKAFRDWLQEAPQNAIDFERLRRWHLVQEELAAKAAREGRIHVVTDDGLR